MMEEAGGENGKAIVIEYCVQCDRGRCLSVFGRKWFYLQREDCRAPVREVFCPACAGRIPLARRKQMESEQPHLQLLEQ